MVALYSATAIVFFVLPAGREFGHMLIGTKLIAFDPFLTAGTLEWGYRSLFSTTRRFFEWNAGFPLHNSLAITENVVGWQLFYYPLRLLGVGVPAAYNLVLLGSLVISGVGAALLARRFGCGRLGAALCGFIFGFGPFHINNFMNLQIMAVCWTPFAILFLDRFLEKPNWSDAAGVAAMFIITTLSSIYIGVFLALFLPAYVLLAWLCKRYTLNRNAVGMLAIVAALSAVALSPMAIPYLRFAAENGRYGTTAVEVSELSIDWGAITRTPSFQMAWVHSSRRWDVPWDGQPAFVGIAALVLIAAGVYEMRRGREQRAEILTLLSLSLFSYLLALGPYFKTVIDDDMRMIKWVPMPGRLWLLMPGIRSPSRFFFFAWLGSSILAGIGLSAILRRLQSSARPLVAFVAIVFVVGEYWPARWLTTESLRAVQPTDMSDAYPFLSQERDSGGVIEFPEKDSRGRGLDFGPYIYAASGHLRRVVSLHGNRRMPVIDSLRHVGALLPDDSARAFLANHGVTRIVVHRFIGDSTANDRLIESLSAARYPLLFRGRESEVFAVPH